MLKTCVEQRSRQLVALTVAVFCVGCAGATDEPAAPTVDRSQPVAVGSSGKADSLNDRECSYERDGEDNQAYCLTLARDACDADPECYFQHSIPLYGGSFCSAMDASDCEEAGGCDPAVACLPTTGVPTPEPAPEPELVCEFERGSDAHDEYCGAYAEQAECEADPGCYFQHSTPLYGGSFCAAVDEGRLTVQNVACGEVDFSTPPPQRYGDIVITEIMRNPEARRDSAGEWFEVFNNSQVAWNLSGCVLHDDGTNHHVIGDLEIAPESIATLAISSDPGFEPDYVYSNFTLANGEDEIYITCDGVRIADVAYDTSWGFVPGRSLQLHQDLWSEDENDDPSAWCVSSMTYDGGDYGRPGGGTEVGYTCD